MAKFEEEKVINALHTEKAEVGKKYWFSDTLKLLKITVEENHRRNITKLVSIKENCTYPFEVYENGQVAQFLYPYEEPSKQRMTYIQLMEWLSKGNGIFNYKNGNTYYYTDFAFMEQRLNDEVDEDIRIRTWDSEEWIEPTVDIYERDCKGGKE